MLEIKSQYNYILKHPNKECQISIALFDKEAREDWLPYLRQFDNMLNKQRVGSVTDSTVGCDPAS